MSDQWQPGTPPRHPAIPPQFQHIALSQPTHHQPQPPQFQLGHQQQPYRRPPRRGGVPVAALVAAGVILAAGAGGTFYVLRSHSVPAAALTCPQQYQAWRTGPAKPLGVKVKADAAAISKAGDDFPVLTSDLETLGTDAGALQAYPIPKCADPAGYWPQYLGAMKAAGDNAGTSPGLGGLLLADVPLKKVPGIQSKLTAELARTAGLKPS